ncbi:MAG: hypothetical protein SNH63_01500 [Rikenellaceae bacterium]
MSITQIILEYLAANRRITVAGLGTFLTKQGSSIVVFSEFVKEDDGVLHAELVARGLKELEAMAVIDRYVFDLKYALTTEGRVEYILPQLGRMTMFGGVLSFEHDPAAQEIDLTVPEVVVEQPESEPQAVVVEQPTVVEVAASSDEEPVVADDNLFDSFAGYASEGGNLDVKESFDKWWILIPVVAVVVLLVAVFYWLAVEWMYGNMELPGFLDSLMRSIFSDTSVPGGGV